MTELIGRTLAAGGWCLVCVTMAAAAALAMVALCPLWLASAAVGGRRHG